MNTRILIPHPALQPYIKHYIYSEMGISKRWTCTNSAPPGCTALVITCEDKNVWMKKNEETPCKYEPVAFSGQTINYNKISLYDRLKSFFVIFRPFGAYPLLGIHQEECKETFTNLVDLLGSSIQCFKEKLAEQSNTEGIKAVVENFFMEQLEQQRKQAESKQLACVIGQIWLNSHHNNLIKNICRQEGYSISRLERHMKEIVGMGPKQFQRIVRFNKALQYINRNPFDRHWPAIANRFGYFDQTHFIKEFKLFYGKTPTDYTEKDQFLSSIAFKKKMMKIS